MASENGARCHLSPIRSPCDDDSGWPRLGVSHVVRRHSMRPRANWTREYRHSPEGVALAGETLQPPLPLGRKDVLVAASLSLVFLALQALLIANPYIGAIDFEEGMVAAQARLLDWTHPSEWLRLSYRPFCGGCDIAAVVSNGLFNVLGDAVWVWRLGLVPYQLAWVTGCWLLGRRLGGPWTGAVALVMAMFPPPLIVLASVRGWTNHFEAIAVATLAAGCLVWATSRRMSAFAGALAGLAVFVSWTAVPAVLTLSVLAGRDLGPVNARTARTAALWPIPFWTLRLAAGVPAWDLGEVPHVRVFSWSGLSQFVDVNWAASVGVLGDSGPRGFALAIASGVGFVLLNRALASSAGKWAMSASLLLLVVLTAGPFRLGPAAYPAVLHARYLIAPLMLLWVAAVIGLCRSVPHLPGWVLVGAMLALCAPGVLIRTDLAARPLTFAPLTEVPAPAWEVLIAEGVRGGGVPATWSCRPSDGECLAVRTFLTDQRDERSHPWRRPDRRCGSGVTRLATREPQPSSAPPGCGEPWAIATGWDWTMRFGTSMQPQSLAEWDDEVRRGFERGRAMAAGALESLSRTPR